MEHQSSTNQSVMKRIILGLRSLPARIVAYLAAKRRAKQASSKLAQHAIPMELKQELVRELRAGWKSQGEQRAETPIEPLSELYNEQERTWIHRIRHETEIANQNNVTRTEAYRAVYFRSPELHWALLAHVVSRNGGWNMTDLQGELLPRLLDRAYRKQTFLLLERANAMIFQDAYPQLLLYEASRKEGRELFSLLPAFGVSGFMRPVWSQFWRRKDPAILTTALIVNEQHVIEAPLVRSTYFKEHVLRKPAFLLQTPLQTNAVFMPYGAPNEGAMKLAGLVLENFRNIEERIEFGKRLYAILYGVPEVHRGVLAFVRAVHHTGSRADYAPHLFTKQLRSQSTRSYVEKLDGCKLKRRAKKFASPELTAAWQDVPVEIGSREDWFQETSEVERYFEQLPMPEVFVISEEHCLAINKIELAVLAAQQLKPSTAQDKRR